MKKIRWILLITSLVVFTLPGYSMAVPLSWYDGSLSDWGVTLTLGGPQNLFTNSWKPTHGWFKAQDYPTIRTTDNPPFGGEGYDVEAIYADVQKDGGKSYWHVAIVTSFPQALGGLYFKPGDIRLDTPTNFYAFGIRVGDFQGGALGDIVKDATWIDPFGLLGHSGHIASWDPNYDKATGTLVGNTPYLAYVKQGINGDNGVWTYVIELAWDSSLTPGITSIGWMMNCDNDSIDIPVPEPATMLLLGSGLIGLTGFARRRFKK